MYVCQAGWHIALVPGHFCNSLQKISVNWIYEFWFIWVLYVHNFKNAICWKFQICNNWQICNLEQIAELQICKFAVINWTCKKISFISSQQMGIFAKLQFVKNIPECAFKRRCQFRQSLSCVLHKMYILAICTGFMNDFCEHSFPNFLLPS